MNIKQQHDKQIAAMIDRLQDKGCKYGKPTKQMIKSALTTHPSA